jgi:hypothetical protein
MISWRLYAAPAGDEVNDQHDNGKHQQDVNEPTQCVRADQAKQPKHQQDYKYCPQHNFPPLRVYLPSWQAAPVRLFLERFLAA